MKRAHRILHFSIALVLLSSLALLGSRSVFAAGVVGTGTPGSCTEAALTTAITGGGTVTFNCGAAPATIALSVQNQISANTTVDGGNKITLDAGNTRHFQVFDGYTLTLRNIKLKGGSSNSGGSIENFGTVKTNNVLFLKNSSTGKGGAINNYGTVIAKNTVFRKNTSGTGGGAIWHEGAGKVKINLSVLKGNQTTGGTAYGGAIANNGAKLIANASTFKNNHAIRGGAIWNAAGKTTNSKASTFSKNTADLGAAIYNAGMATFDSALIVSNTSDGDAGGISNAGALTLKMSTVRGNQAVLGGAIFHSGTALNIQQSTLSGNTTPDGDGGAVYSTGPATVVNSTISGNSVVGAGGGGAWYQSENIVTFKFTTIANNTASFGGGVYAFGFGSPAAEIRFQNSVLSNNIGGNCSGTPITSLSHNVSSDASCAAAFTQMGDKNNKNPNLGALANNGGPTMTHLPLLPSPLVNKGAADPTVTTDQRNFPRPVGPKTDIGAVEVQ